jgi:hypothetical protein
MAGTTGFIKAFVRLASLIRLKQNNRRGAEAVRRLLDFMAYQHRRAA